MKESPRTVRIKKAPKDSEDIRKDVEAQLDMLKNTKKLIRANS